MSEAFTCRWLENFSSIWKEVELLPPAWCCLILVVVKLHVLLVKVSSPVSKTSIKAVTFSSLACYSQTWKMCTSIRVGKFHSRVLSSIPPPSPPVSPAHFHMIVQKILQLCKEMIFTSGIPNEDCVGGNNEKMLPQITSNHLPKRNCKKDTLQQVQFQKRWKLQCHYFNLGFGGLFIIVCS